MKKLPLILAVTGVLLVIQGWLVDFNSPVNNQHPSEFFLNASNSFYDISKLVAIVGAIACVAPIVLLFKNRQKS
jgi:hypothetical protein